MENKDFNHGLIYVAENKPTDYIYGGYNGVAHDILQASKDWGNDLTNPEYQTFKYFDPFDCVTRSSLKILAALFMKKYALGKIRPQDWEWLITNGYLVNGKINFDDQFIATVANTQCNIGNYQATVADVIRTYGLTPQSRAKDPNTYNSCPAYYEQQPQWKFDLGVEFKKRFELNYEWVPTSDKEQLRDALQYSPLQVIVRAWYKNDQGLYYNPAVNGEYRFNHAVELYVLPGTYFIQDSYSDYDQTPDRKELVSDYHFGNSAMVWFITNNVTNNIMELKENYLYQLIDRQSTTGGFGIVVGGKLICEDELVKILATFEMRNHGDTKGKTIEVKTLAEWNSVKHYNLKLQEVPSSAK